METRDILDYLGNICGQLELPDGTSEEVWTAQLAPYALNPANIPATNSGLTTKALSASSSVTTSSSTPSTVGSMTHLPEMGFYRIDFNGSIYTAGASAVGDFGIYIDGVLIAETRRDISCNLQLLGGLVTVSLNTLAVGTFTGTEVYLNGNQTVDVKFRSTNGGTIGFKERVFTFLRVR